jgi:hypothetical protein
LVEDRLLGNEEYDEENDVMEELLEMLKVAQMQVADLMRYSTDSDIEGDKNSVEGESESEDHWDDEEGQGGVHVSSHQDDQVQGAMVAKKSAKSEPKGKKNKKQEKKKDIEYQFCPHAHCLAIIHLFCRHFNQHPLLPEQHGQTCTSKQIYQCYGMDLFVTAKDLFGFVMHCYWTLIWFILIS